MCLPVCMGSEPAAGCSQVLLCPLARQLAAGILWWRLFHHRGWRVLGGRRWPLGGRRRLLEGRWWSLGGWQWPLAGRRRPLGRRRGPPRRRQAGLDYLVDALAGAGLVFVCERCRRLGDASAVTAPGAPPEVGVLAAGLLAGLQQAPAHVSQLSAAIGQHGGGVGREAQSIDCCNESKLQMIGRCSERAWAWPLL